jgi:hypothetical protein
LPIYLYSICLYLSLPLDLYCHVPVPVSSNSIFPELSLSSTLEIGLVAREPLH